MVTLLKCNVKLLPSYSCRTLLTICSETIFRSIFMFIILHNISIQALLLHFSSHETPPHLFLESQEFFARSQRYIHVSHVITSHVGCGKLFSHRPLGNFLLVRDQYAVNDPLRSDTDQWHIIIEAVSVNTYFATFDRFSNRFVDWS